ncbi:PAAR domain-containing protein, partial [Pectobacterium versatile]
MGNAVKLGDSDTGHGNHLPTPVAAGSSTVKVDGMPLARQGDPLAPHGHDRSI